MIDVCYLTLFAVGNYTVLRLIVVTCEFVDPLWFVLLLLFVSGIFRKIEASFKVVCVSMFWLWSFSASYVNCWDEWEGTEGLGERPRLQLDRTVSCLA